MGDPGLGAGDLVDIAAPRRPGLQAGEVGAGVGLGEHRRRQDLAGGDPGQKAALLLLGAAVEDEFAGDLGTGADGADADIAARELLGDDAHGFLAESHAAVVLRQRQGEHAEFGHVGDGLKRDIAVGAVPGLRVRHHFAVGELAHFLADRIEGVVETAVADGGVVAMDHQFDQPGAVRDRVAGADQPFHRGVQAGADLFAGEPEIERAHELALAHRNAAEDLGEVFTDPDADDELLDVAEAPGLRHALRIGGELPDRVRISGEPGEAMGGALLAVEQPPNGAALDAHTAANLDDRVAHQGVHGGCRLARHDDQVFAGRAAMGGNRHSGSPGLSPGMVVRWAENQIMRALPESKCAVRTRSPAGPPAPRRHGR